MNIDNAQILKRLRSITVENRKVDKGGMYLVNLVGCKTQKPVFVKVLCIYYSDRPYIIAKMFLARSFEMKYHAYGTFETDKINILTMNQIIHHKPLCNFTYRDQLFVLRNFHVFFYIEN